MDELEPTTPVSTITSIEIVKAEIQTSVQDLGRSGNRHLGICQAGALDALSLIMANQLVGNPRTHAGLEITVGPVEIRFQRSAWFAICGADFDARLDGLSIAPAWRHHAQSGQILRLHGAKHEARAYLAIDGGIDVPLMLGARATDSQAGFGGWQGRFLRNGDCLPLGSHHHFERTLGMQQRTWTPEIRALPGPEYEEFDPNSRSLFWQQRWTVSHQSNRMAYRLQGKALSRNSHRDLLSHGVMPGVVQVPANGQPIVLLADAQTTGGYPRIATVIEADLWKIAQTPAGKSVHFVQTDIATAINAQEKWCKELSRLDQLEKKDHAY